jgi:hypothetical protein
MKKDRRALKARAKKDKKNNGGGRRKKWAYDSL